MSSLEQQRGAALAPRRPARAELVGSMVRPPEVIEAFRRVFPSRDALGEHPRGQGSEEERDHLVEVATAAIASIVRRQVDAGVDVVVNGEFNRWTFGPEVYDAGIYRDPDEAFAELLAVQRSLVDDVVAAGAPYVQLDYPAYTHAADPSWVKVFRDGGVDRDALVDRSIVIDNAMIVAPETIVVLGIVDTKSRKVETEDELLAKLEEASRYIDVGQLAISPQCGFSSAVGINDATEIQWQKIDVICRVADRVWGRA